MKKNIILNLAASAAVILAAASCDKVSPTGVLIGGTSVNDRVDMSYTYYRQYMNDTIDMETVPANNGEYSFLVGSDSHIADDDGRLYEMIDSGLSHGDLLWASLGDIADTKAEYYITLKKALEEAKTRYTTSYFSTDNRLPGDSTRLPDTYQYDTRYPAPYSGDPDGFKHMYYSYDKIPFPFYSVVGNHDITRNGWALFSDIFHSSFFEFTVKIGKTDQYDHFIFLDTASGTLGDKQIDLLKQSIFDVDKQKQVRHTFVFSHTNLFRPSSMQFSSTFPREELYFLLNKFAEWNTTIVFCGHVHKWDDRTIGGVRYLTLDSMSERNSPNAGDYLVRVTCHADGTLDVQRVHMSYVKRQTSTEEE